MIDKFEETVRAAVSASLGVIDGYTEGKTKRSSGPCGDKLANALDTIIRKSLADYETEARVKK